MRTVPRLSRLLLLVLVPLIHRGPVSSTAPSLPERVLAQEGCTRSFEQLIQDEHWFDELINPVITTQSQLWERLALYSEIYDCLDDSPSLPDDLAIIRVLTEHFLVFAGGAHTPREETSLQLISLHTCTDPAVVRIRDQAGIKPPRGYIYVRFYSSREAMPPLVRRAFEQESTAGVTILMRYVAALAEEKETWPEQRLQSETLPQTISHELAHAYVNSVLGIEHIGQLPTWYHEGIAIYFSESGRDHVVVTHNFEIRKTSPKDYKQYDTNFRYLEAELGREHLLELIKQSIERAEPSLLYRDLSIPDDQTLTARARVWKQRRDLYKVGIITAAGLLVVWGIFRVMPEARCDNCFYTGKRREFAEGRCPMCGSLRIRT